jgi:hypothetical protein
MTSDKKKEANRQNALKSTGPRTPQGKAAVRLNALKHGLLSQEILLPGEDGEALRELSERLRAELQPVGVLENLLVDRVIAAVWRLQRLSRVETGIFAYEFYGQLAESAEKEVRSYVSYTPALLADKSYIDNLISSGQIDMEKTTITDKEKHEKALAKARKLRSEQDAEIATLGRTFVRDADKANAFSKLSRYETAIERQLYRALHELERHQAARRGQGVPAPVAVDVDVSGIPEDGR